MEKPDYSRSTVQALIKTLEQLPKENLVLVASDAEGNDFNPLDGLDFKAFWSEKDRDILFTEEGEPDPSEARDDVYPAIVIFPQHR